MKCRRILLLGSTGFIGRNLYKKLAMGSEIEVIGKSLPEIDLTDEKSTSELSSLLAKNTVVVMCSALKKNHGDNLETFSKNVEMVKNLCKAVEKNPVGKIIYFSSSAVYGENIHNTNITEKTAVNPTSFYGIAKFTSERILLMLEKVPVVILRPPVIYGPENPDTLYDPAGFVQKAINKEEIILWGDGSEKREFIFIDDVVKIVRELACNNFRGVVNVVSGTSYTFKKILKIIEEKLGPINISSKPRTRNKVDHGFDNSLIKKVIPDISFTSLELGITKLVEQ